MVRDFFLTENFDDNTAKTIKSKDVDIEVYGVTSYSELEKLLSKYGQTNLVGQAFGVIKFKFDNEEDEFDEETGNANHVANYCIDNGFDFYRTNFFGVTR